MGGLLTASLLDRVRANDRSVPGLEPEAYHLLKGERFGEATARSWTRLQTAWLTLKEQLGTLPGGDTATTATRERFLLPLFDELGYGRLQVSRALTVEERTYAISHGWNAVPIHLVGARVPLDRRSSGVRGAAGQSPHGLLQDYLNRADDALWGMVSNGLVLRLLRDNASLTRQAYVEFDLEAIFDGQLYADFVLLWLICHQSRLEGARPEACFLEQWRQEASKAGTRALDRLRDGVEEAIVTLGAGFLKHPANGALRDAVRAGHLEARDYYRQLLRVVYRLIFVFVAEDRDALLHPDASDVARQRYQDHYSTAWLRELAMERRGSRHPDLWRVFQLVVRALGSDDGAPAIGLPALGGFLFSPEATPDLDGAQLSNRNLLSAVRALALIEDRGVRLPVDFRNLGSEELGSIYESLLAYHPRIHPDAPSFVLASAAGSERKTSGSYYTPTSLISVLLDSALDPVLAEAANKRTREEAIEAILDLRVVDPAVGSGHFLVAAAHRIARKLASVRMGDEEPSPADVQRALRDVVGRCLYGVDLNPDAAELCRVGLWLEAIQPGRPLSFLDSHIRVGNSLLGATPELLAGLIPDSAFEPIGDDDDKVRARDLLRRNREERGGQTTLDELVPVGVDTSIAAEASAIASLPDDDAADIARIATRYAGLRGSAAYLTARLLADAWCAAMVIPKAAGMPAITSATLRKIARDPAALDTATREAIQRLADSYRFFHWHLEFPHIFPTVASRVGAASPRRGFDVVLGNPPWERFKLQEEEFFAVPRPDIAGAANAAARKRLIAKLGSEDPALFRAFKSALRRADGASHIVRKSGRYPLSGRGDVNTYPVFAELMRSLLTEVGRVGVIVPTGIATDDTTKFLFRDLVDGRSLVSLFDFENRNAIFPGVHRSYKFCLLTLSGSGRPIDEAQFVFFALDVNDLDDPERRFTLSPDDFQLLNPNTRTCPIFRSRRDADITKSIYRRIPVLVDESRGEIGNPWGVSFLRMFDMATDSGLFRTRQDLESSGWQLQGNVFSKEGQRYLPLYEAKMIHQYDHRFGDYGMRHELSEGVQLPDVPLKKLQDLDYAPLARYWVHEAEIDQRLEGRWEHPWLMGWRQNARATDSRTMISTVFPRTAVGHSLFVLLATARDAWALPAVLNSLLLDYILRQKLGGVNLSYFVVNQLAILGPEHISAHLWQSRATVLADWLRPRVAELVGTSRDMLPFLADSLGCSEAFTYSLERRAQLRAEIDAAIFLAYGVVDDDVDYILDSFTVLRQHELDQFGGFVTKRRVVGAIDRIRSTDA